MKPKIHISYLKKQNRLRKRNIQWTEPKIHILYVQKKSPLSARQALYSATPLVQTVLARHKKSICQLNAERLLMIEEIANRHETKNPHLVSQKTSSSSSSSSALVANARSSSSSSSSFSSSSSSPPPHFNPPLRNENNL